MEGLMITKLTETQKKGIRRIYEVGNTSYRRLARKYGVSFTCIRDAIYPRRYYTYQRKTTPSGLTYQEYQHKYYLEVTKPKRKGVL